MEIFSLISILILIFVVLAIEKILTHGVKFLFYTALAVFVVVFVFGISLNDVILLLGKFILWVF